MCISGPKKNLVFRATVFKTFGRVGSIFFKNLYYIIFNYKDPKEKSGIFVKKSLGSAGSDRVGLPETQDFVLGLSIGVLTNMIYNRYTTFCYHTRSQTSLYPPQHLLNISKIKIHFIFLLQRCALVLYVNIIAAKHYDSILPVRLL